MIKKIQMERQSPSYRPGAWASNWSLEVELLGGARGATKARQQRSALGSAAYVEVGRDKVGVEGAGSSGRSWMGRRGAGWGRRGIKGEGGRRCGFS